MQSLAVDDRGYPVPHFVAWIDGKPDFRVVHAETALRCWNRRRCWICGQELGRTVAFVIGPMCAINRVSSEPPQHRECAEFAAKACPFLTRPRAKRREAGLPEESQHPAGIMLARNPGVALVWITREPSVMKLPDGWLFNVGNPAETLWFAEGRTATRAEVMASIDSGLPALRQVAQQDGAAGARELQRAIDRAMPLLPAE
jgi:hypothetical protein